jgi:hypothetical protein
MEAKTEVGFEDLLFKLVDKFPRVRSLKNLVDEDVYFDKDMREYKPSELFAEIKISESTNTELMRFLEILDYIQSMADVLANSEPSNWIFVGKFVRRLDPSRITKKEWKVFLTTIKALTPKIAEKINREGELVYFPMINDNGELRATYY